MAGPFSLQCILHLKGEPVKKLFPIVVTFVLAAILGGCSTSDSTAGPEPSSSPTESAQDEWDVIPSMQRGMPKLVQNDLDAEFLKIAFDSCKKALEDGFVIEDTGSTSYFISSSDSIFSKFKIKEAAVTNGVVGEPKYFYTWPAIFDPCDTLTYADVLKPTDDNYVMLEHSLEKTNEGTYKWGQHHGGANLDVTEYSVGADGLISSYRISDWYSKVRYGPLSQQELNYFK